MWISLVLLACTIQLVASDCEQGWHLLPLEKFCVKIVHTPEYWLEANTKCKQLGAELASIHSMEDNRFITSLVDSYKQRTINPHTEIPLFLWIGLTYIRGSWSWTDGTELNFLPWSLYTPNNAKNDGTRYCTHIWTATPFCPSCGQRYYWNDIKCTYKMRYACKKPHTDDTTSSEENQQKPAAYECQGGWSLLPGENSCVKVVHTPENWQQANVNCKQIGSELASVHNMEDNIFITRLVDSFVKQAMDPRTNGKTEMLWIGLRFSDNSWFWSDGKPLNFSAWSVSRPNNAMNDGKEYCGHIWPADAPHFGQRYYWNDELCSYKMRYACKQPASLKVKCKTDWLPLNGTTTCIENRRTPTKNNRELLENNLRAKCVGLPKKSYFDPATWTCFVDSSDCDFVQFPSDRYKRVDVSRVRGELEKRKIRTDSSKICAFVPTYRCGNKIVSNGNSCFWLTEKEDSWSGASNDCQKKGGNLFVPHNDGDMQVALDYLTATGAESSAVWVGLVLTDKWIAVDSSEVNYLRWTSSVETYSTKAALGSLFLHDKMSKTDGSYAAYIRLEKESSKFFGLCSQPLI